MEDKPVLAARNKCFMSMLSPLNVRGPLFALALLPWCLIQGFSQDCALFPIALSENSLQGKAAGDVLTDILNGEGSGEFGWLTWAGSPSEPALALSLTYPGNSGSYVNPDNTDDESVSIGDWILARPGVANSKKIRSALDSLIGIEILVPVWDQTRCQDCVNGNGGGKPAYRVSGFAQLRITDYRLPGDNRISAVFLGLASCGESNQPPSVDAGIDQTITFPSPALLQGSVSDDGLPPLSQVAVSWVLFQGPEGATVSFQDPLSLVTTASFSDPGTYLLRLNADDGQYLSFDEVIVTVNRSNQAPEALSFSIETNEDESVSFLLQGTDPDGDTISYEVTSEPPYGTLTGTPPAIHFLSIQDWNGTNTFSYKVSDGALTSPDATVTIIVHPINDPPDSVSQVITNAEDQAFSVFLSGSDVEGSVLSYEIITLPAHGTLTLLTNNYTYLYTPLPDYHGADEFTYRTFDGFLYSEVSTVSITLTNVNDAPEVNAGEDILISLPTQNVTLSGQVLDDWFLNAPISNWSLINGPAPVSFSNPADLQSTVSFTESGIYYLQLTVDDGFFIVTDDLIVTVNAPPIVSVGLDQAITLPNTVQIIGSVSDDALGANSQLSLSWQAVAGPGTVIFSHPNALETEASFSDSGLYLIRLSAFDGYTTSSDSLTVLVNRAPIVDAGQDLSISGLEVQLIGSALDDGLPNNSLSLSWQKVSGPGEVTFTPASEFGGTEVTLNSLAQFSVPGVYTLSLQAFDLMAFREDIIEVEVNDIPQALSQTITTLEDHSVSISLSGDDSYGSPIQFEIISLPQTGTLNSTLGFIQGSLVLYTPFENFNGFDSFQFRVFDGITYSLPASVEIQILPVNDGPVIQPIPEQQTQEMQLWTYQPSAFDQDNNAVTFSLLGQPAGMAINETNGLMEWTPSETQGPDQITFQILATDNGEPPLTGSVQIQIQVNEVNTPPVLQSIPPLQVIEGQPFSYLATAQDSDLPFNSLTFSFSGTVPNGMIINPITGEIDWTPPEDYGPTTLLLSLTVNDDGIPPLSDQIDWTLEVLDSNRAPISYDQTLTVNEDSLLEITLVSDDPDLDIVSFQLDSQPAHGTLEGDGYEWIYRPNTNFFGSDEFSFHSNDGALNSPPATIHIQVLPVNDPPSVTNQSFQVQEGQSTNIILSAFDPDGDVLIFQIEQQPSIGVLSGSGSNWVYQANIGTYGSDGIGYRVSDGVSLSELAFVSIEVTPFIRSKTYTSNTDFQSGSITNLILDPPDQLQTTSSEVNFNYVWVPLNSKGTVVRLELETGQVLGEYRTAPDTASNPFPSRTMIDRDGNLWVANERDQSVLMIAAPESGRWIDRNNNGVLDTSSGLGDVFPWANNGGEDTFGGTTTASDETIVFYTKVSGQNIRHLSFDHQDRLWVGGSTLNHFDLIDRMSGSILRTEPSIGRGGFGGFVDRQGILYSTGDFLIWDTSLSLSLAGSSQVASEMDGSWAVAQDSEGNLWVTYDPSSEVKVFSPDGESLASFYHGGHWGQGIAIDPTSGDVWIAHSHCGRTVGHLTRDGTWVGNVEVDYGPTAVSIDRRGRVWVSNTSGTVQRINPLGGPIGTDGMTPVGEVELTSQFLGPVRAYSHFTGAGTGMSAVRGTWSAIYDSGLFNATWGPVSWNALLQNDSNLQVQVATGSTSENFSHFQTITLQNSIPQTLGRFLKVQVDFLPSSTGEGSILEDLSVGTQDYLPPSLASSWSITAGPDLQSQWPEAVRLKGVVTRSDSSDLSQPVVLWSLISGPGTVQFSNPSSYQPEVQFSLEGTYVFELSVTYRGQTFTDQTQVTLAPYNRAPWVDAGPPQFVSQAGDSVTLQGEVRDDGLPANQAPTISWVKITGPGDALFVDPSNPTTPVSFTSDGIYILELRVNDGEFEKRAPLEVRVGAFCTVEDPDGLVSWWQATCSGADHVSGNEAFLTGGAGFTPGQVGLAFNFDGLNDALTVFASPTLDIGKSEGLTIEFWAKAGDTSTGTLLSWMDGSIQGLRIYQRTPSSTFLEIEFWDDQGNNHLLSHHGWTAGLWHHVAITYEKTTGMAHLFLNGQLQRRINLGTFNPQTAPDLIIGGDSTWGFWKGALDEISLYNRALSSGEIQAIFSSGAVGKCPRDDNRPPVVLAGQDIILLSGMTSADLPGIVQDDGLPTGILESQWSLASGSGSVLFSDPNSPQSQVTFSSPGVYLLELWAHDGSIEAKDHITVRVEAPCDSISSDNLVAWWNADSSFSDQISGISAIPSGGVGFEDGRQLLGFHFSGDHQFLRIPTNEALDVGLSGSFSFEFWVRSENPFSDQRLLSFHDGVVNGLAIGIRFTNDLEVELPSLAGIQNLLSIGGFFTANQLHHVAVTFNATTQIVRIYRDGQLMLSRSVPGFPFRTHLPLYLGSRDGLTQFFQGNLDELTIWNRDLSPDEVFNIFEASFGKCLPDIQNAPLVDAGNDTVLTSSSANLTLSGNVSDDGLPLNYLSSLWEMLAGPSPVTFSDPSSPLSQAQFSSPGIYILQLTATDGARSAQDTVEIRVDAECLGVVPPHAVAWWPGNGDASETIQNLSTHLVGGTQFQDGKVGGSFYFENEKDMILVPQNPSLDFTTSQGLTIEFWIRFSNVPNAMTDRQFILGWQTGVTNGIVVSHDDHLRIDFYDSNGIVKQVRGFGEILAGTWNHVAVTFDSNSGVARYFHNGSHVDTKNFGDFQPITTLDFHIGNIPLLGGGLHNQQFRGNLDELSLYSRALTETEIQRIYQAQSTGKCPGQPNAAPVVFAGSNQFLSDTNLSANLQGWVSDDGQPSYLSLTSQWTVLGGPGTVSFGNAASPVTSASFSTNGVYVLQLTGSDGHIQNQDVATLRIASPCLITNPTNLTAHWAGDGDALDALGQSPGFLSGDTRFTNGWVGASFSFDGTNDWMRANAAPQLNLGASSDGYTVEFWMNPALGGAGGSSSRFIAGWENGPTIRYYTRLRLSMVNTNGIIDGMDSTVSFDINQWQHVAISFDKATQTLSIYKNGVFSNSRVVSTIEPRTTGDFYLGSIPGEIRSYQGFLDEFSHYNRALTPTEIAEIHAAGRSGKCIIPSNHPPTVFAGLDKFVFLPNSTQLFGAVFDDGLPSTLLLSHQWNYAEGPGAVFISDPNQTTLNVSFDLPGQYLFELTATDGEYTVMDSATVTVFPDPRTPPTIVIANLGNPTLVEVDPGQTTPFTLQASAFDSDGTISQVEFFLDSTSLGVDSTFPYHFALPALPAGTYTFLAQATDNDGLVGSSPQATLIVFEDAGPPIAQILTPLDSSQITAPTPVVGTASSPILEEWTLQFRLKPSESDPRYQDDSSWSVLHHSTLPILDDQLAVFDPTLLLNGIYEVRLSATDRVGRTSYSEIHAYIVDRNLKIGHFTLSFSDLTVPVSGIPIEIIRTYDSRDQRTNDFGVGWSLDIRNVRLQKSRNLGPNWYQDTTGGIFPSYWIDPVKARQVSIAHSDGRVFKFNARMSPTNQFLIPITAGTVIYDPTPDTYGVLESLRGDDVLIAGSLPGFMDLFDVETGGYYNPTLFKLTTEEGETYVIDETDGLQSYADRTGNTLVISTNGVIWTNVITGGPSLGVTFERDTQGRILKITDPQGNALNYSYGANGLLSTFKDRETNITSYAYTNLHFPHYLTEITDPRGVKAIRTEYDDAGRMIRQIDGEGHFVEITHDLANQVEIIRDRLGNVTFHEYDDRGNVTRTIDPLGNVTSYTFDGNDNQTEMVDALGNIHSSTYDTKGNKLSETDPLGYITQYTYGQYRELTSHTNPRGFVSTKSYDPATGDLLQETDPLGQVTSYTYNLQGNLASRIDPLGNIMTNAYDSLGRMISTSTVDPQLGILNQTTYTYDLNGNQLSQSVQRTTSSGIETLLTQYSYDKENRLIQTIHPDGSTNRIIYALGLDKPAVEIDELGRQKLHFYDPRGNLINTVYSDLTSEFWSFDAESRKSSMTDKAGRVTAYGYDPLARMTNTLFADGTSSNVVYDAIGRIHSTQDERGNQTWFGYDPNCGCSGRQSFITNALGQVTLRFYDENGNETALTDALGRTTTFLYDELDRHTHTLFPDGSILLATYDAIGRRIAETDQNTNTTWYAFDALSRLVAVTNALGHVTTYDYDETGNLIAQTDANLHTTTYEYDTMGRRVKRTLPGGQIETYQYDLAGNLTGKTDFNGRTTTYTYDVLNRLLSKTPDSVFTAPAVTYTYTPTGQRATMNDASGLTTYEYDLRDRLQSKATPQGTLVYSHDGVGNVTLIGSTTTNGLALTYTYDALNRLETATDPHTGTTTYTYYAVGNLAGYLYPNGVISGYDYDSLNRLTNLTSLSSQSLPITNYRYTVAPSGHRVTANETVTLPSGTQTINRLYTYDATYRLVNEGIGATGVATLPAPANVTYTLDPVGNRLIRTSNLPGVENQTLTYDANDRLISDLYDPNGNTLSGHLIQSEPPVNDAYDFEDRLINRNNGQVIVIYDGDGNRVSKTVGGLTTHFLVDEQNPTGYAQVMEEWVALPNQPPILTRVYAYGHDLISQDQLLEDGQGGMEWVTRFYGYDGHGNVRYLTDGSGVVTDTYDYDAFGTIIAETGSSPNAYLYCGEQFDFDLGLYYNRARYLNIDSGRFWTRDVWEGDQLNPITQNSYIYSNTDPINGLDPSGESTTASESLLTTQLRGLHEKYLARETAQKSTKRIRGQLCKAAAAGIQAYNSMDSIPGFQRHHIYQKSAFKGIGKYSQYTALSIWLLGGSDKAGSPHYLANKAQPNPGLFDKGSEIAKRALIAAGCSKKDADKIVEIAKQQMEEEFEVGSL